MTAKRILTIATLLAVLPAVALANKMSELASQNIHILALGEIGIVFLETALLRWLFRLSFFDALKVSFFANIASFLIGIVLDGFLGGAFGGLHMGNHMMSWLSDLYFARLGDELSARELVSPYLLGMVMHTLGNTLIESPVLYSLLSNFESTEVRGRGLRVAVVNLISYPIFFTVLFIAAVWRTGSWSE